MRASPPTRFFGIAVLFSRFALGSAGALLAQAPTGPDTTESTTDDSSGTVIGLSPHRTITVDSQRGPFTYRLGQDLHIFGPDNRPLKITDVHAGDEATVYYYIRDGQQTIGRIVVLRRGKPARK